MLGVMRRGASEQGWMREILAARQQGVGETEGLEVAHEGEGIAVADGQSIGVGDGKCEAGSLQ